MERSPMHMDSSMQKMHCIKDDMWKGILKTTKAINQISKAEKGLAQAVEKQDTGELIAPFCVDRVRTVPPMFFFYRSEYFACMYVCAYVSRLVPKKDRRRKMQIKTTLRFLHLSEWKRSKTQVIAHDGEDVEQGEQSSIANGIASLHSRVKTKKEMRVEKICLDHQ
ncbi:hypothetical protein STEG23_016953 [Scotinomys teguina]